MSNKKTSSKSPMTGTKVEHIKEHSLAVETLLNCGNMYLFTIIFSIFGIIFILDSIPSAAKIAIGAVFIIPVGVVQFAKGRAAGEKEYKLRNQTTLSDIHSQRINNVNTLKPFILVLPYVLSAILLTVIAVTAKIQWIQGVMLIIFIPITLIFLGSGIIVLDGTGVTWYSVLAVSVFVIVISTAYVVGYFYGVHTLKKRASELVNEIRSYE